MNQPLPFESMGEMQSSQSTPVIVDTEAIAAAGRGRAATEDAEARLRRINDLRDGDLAKEQGHGRLPEEPTSHLNTPGPHLEDAEEDAEWQRQRARPVTVRKQGPRSNVGPNRGESEADGVTPAGHYEFVSSTPEESTVALGGIEAARQVLGAAKLNRRTRP